jgi:hypothetical protein
MPSCLLSGRIPSANQFLFHLFMPDLLPHKLLNKMFCSHFFTFQPFSSRCTFTSLRHLPSLGQAILEPSFCCNVFRFCVSWFVFAFHLVFTSPLHVSYQPSGSKSSFCLIFPEAFGSREKRKCVKLTLLFSYSLFFLYSLFTFVRPLSLCDVRS